MRCVTHFRPKGQTTTATPGGHSHPYPYWHRFARIFIKCKPREAAVKVTVSATATATNMHWNSPKATRNTSIYNSNNYMWVTYASGACKWLGWQTDYDFDYDYVDEETPNPVSSQTSDLRSQTSLYCFKAQEKIKEGGK